MYLRAQQQMQHVADQQLQKVLFCRQTAKENPSLSLAEDRCAVRLKMRGTAAACPSLEAALNFKELQTGVQQGWKGLHCDRLAKPRGSSQLHMRGGH